MDRYVCKMCGHIYDPAKGEGKPFKVMLCDSSKMDEYQCSREPNVLYVAPGTDFTSLPADWKCPVCGYPKSYYQKIEAEPLAALRTIA